MAKKKAKATTEPIEEEEVEEIEDLEELADTEAEDDSDEEEEDEDEPKKSKKGKAKSKKKASKDGIGTAELAEALDTDGRNLRVMLRKKGANKSKRFKKEGRYHWASVDEALEELGFDDVDDAKEALKEARDERLEELKARPKKDKKKKKAKAKAKDEDEDDEDEDDDE